MIYIVEDDISIRELEQYALKQNGYETIGFANSAEFWKTLDCKIPELVILDIMLPDEDGLTILKKLRANTAYSNIPVILITAKTTELDTVKGLDAGADDYLAKPFGVMEFISRVKLALRHSEKTKTSSDVIVFETIELNHTKHSVCVNNQIVDLTYKEYEILHLLMKQPEVAISREKIMHLVWDTDIAVESRTMDMHFRTLRKKLGSAGNYIQTVRKVGYKLTSEEEKQ